MTTSLDTPTERRKHLRAPLNLDCVIIIPETLFQCRAVIRDASTGGMLIRATRMVQRHLQRPFWIQFKLAGELFQVPVQPVAIHNESEVGVTFRTVTPVLSATLARTVFTALRDATKTSSRVKPGTADQGPTRRQRSEEVKLKSDRAAEAEGSPDELSRLQARKVNQTIRDQHKTMHEALVDARDLHKDRSERWKDKRIVSYD